MNYSFRTIDRVRIDSHSSAGSKLVAVGEMVEMILVRARPEDILLSQPVNCLCNTVVASLAFRADTQTYIAKYASTSKNRLPASRISYIFAPLKFKIASEDGCRVLSEHLRISSDLLNDPSSFVCRPLR
jgi:hypothetical protein